MKNKNEVKPEPQEAVKTQEELQAIEKARNDSIENAQFELLQKTAIGEVLFGMEKQKVEQVNERRQILGKYNYNSNHSYNGDGQLYSLVLNSDSEKAINYDTGLKNKYTNLRKIISIKYGEPVTNRPYPSIFDVQKAGTYWINKWQFGTKQISLGLKENSLNSYIVRCKITDSPMEEDEFQRLKNIKDKDYIEAAEKF